MRTRTICAVVLAMLFSTSIWAAIDAKDGNAVSETIESLRKKIESEKTSKSKKTEATLEDDDGKPAAEAARLAEQDFRSNLEKLQQAVKGIEDRVDVFRQLVVPPTKTEIDRLNGDLNVVERLAEQLEVPVSSPLCQLQKAELQDRLFELQLSVGIMTRRWGDSWNVFGMDFFSNAPTIETPELSVVSDTYRIRFGDRIEVDVSSSVGDGSEYEMRVDASGCITVPGIGKIKAAGKTTDQLKGEICSKLRSQFKQLSADVRVAKARPVCVQVNGEVARPGTYAIAGMATVFSALHQAGGPTKSGSFRRVTLVRAGQPKRIIDLYKFLMNGDKTDDVSLDEGDLIFVPPVGGTVIVEGEVIRPARYEPDFPLTLADALKLAGGPSPGGYLQSVQVERVENGECRVLLDSPSAQDEAKAAFQIQSGDQITVRPVRPDRTSQVAITGPVGAPGLYGFRQGMRVSDLIKAAQGIAQDREVYGGRADILRVDPLKGLELVTFDLDKALHGDIEHDLQLQKLDRVFIYQPEQVVYKMRLITVRGAVSKEGTYKRAQGMSVSDAIAAAGGVTPDAYLSRADLIRRNGDGTTKLIRVDLKKALSRLPGADVKIEDRDVIRIYTSAEAEWSDRTVRVEGAVQRPGVYNRSDNMRLSDLMLACGGLLPEASRSVEIGRWTAKRDSEIIEVDLSKMTRDSDLDILLRDRDVLTVHEVNPALRSPEVVYLVGEVARPGPYALRGDEKLVDLIQRAGGLTPRADRRGLIFLRQKEALENSQQSRDVDIILHKSRLFASKEFVTGIAKLGMTVSTQYVEAMQTSTDQLAKPAEVVADEGQTTGKLASAQAQEAGASNPGNLEKLRKKPTPREIETQSAIGPRIPEVSDINQLDLSMYKGRKELAAVANSARISVDLERAVQNPSFPDNIPLRAGDRISIPRTTDVVTVYGAVLHPHSFAAESGQSVDHFIERSGGFAQDAAKDSVIVVRSNGDALPKNRARTVEPGDIIVVPTTGLIDIAKKWEKISPVAKVISDVLSSVYILTRF